MLAKGEASGLEINELFNPVVGVHEYEYGPFPFEAIDDNVAVAPSQIDVGPFAYNESGSVGRTVIICDDDVQPFISVAITE